MARNSASETESRHCRIASNSDSFTEATSFTAGVLQYRAPCTRPEKTVFAGEAGPHGPTGTPARQATTRLPRHQARAAPRAPPRPPTAQLTRQPVTGTGHPLPTRLDTHPHPHGHPTVGIRALDATPVLEEAARWHPLLACTPFCL